MKKNQPIKWFPKHPEKYAGDVNNIITRSSWERRFFAWADTNPSVVSYSSEEIVIPYLCETDNKYHRYFVDALVKIKDKNNIVSSYLVEIKPSNQVAAPVYPGKNTRSYINKVGTYIKNCCKWKAAKKYAAERNMQFIILTEQELGIGNASKKK